MRLGLRSLRLAPALYAPSQAIRGRETTKNQRGSGRERTYVDQIPVEQATTQIEALGGWRLPLEDFQEYGFRWRVMADPEGNEFCLVYETAGGTTG